MRRLSVEAERRVADGLRDALERYEQALRAAQARLRDDMQAALFGMPEDEEHGGDS